MTVDELIETLRAMPPTAHVDVQIRSNVSYDGSVEELYEFREVGIEAVIYARGMAIVQLDE